MRRGRAVGWRRGRRLTRTEQPDVLLMDIRTPRSAGIGATSLITAPRPRGDHVLLTKLDARHRVRLVVLALRAGQLRGIP